MPLSPLHTLVRVARGAALGALHFVDEFEAEVIHASAELADVLDEHVVCDDRGDRSEESGGRGDESFGDARSNGAKGCGPGGAESVEGVDDAPDGPEQSDERGDCAGGGQPGQAAFEMSQLFRRGNLHGALQRADADGLRGLLAELVIRTFEDCYERGRGGRVPTC